MQLSDSVINKNALSVVNTQIKAYMVHLCRIVCFAFLISIAFADGALSQAKNLQTLSIITKEGHHVFQVEVARTPQQQSQGLMFRQSLPADRGMLFDFNEMRTASFWMKNTYISLDLLFIKANGTISSIISNAQPLSLAPLRSKKPVRAVLEINGGLSARLGIKPGDTVQHSIFANQ